MASIDPLVRLTLGLALLAPLPSGALEITFSPGLSIGHTLAPSGVFRTDFVDTQGFHFETFQGGVLAINTFVGEGRQYGGLWDGGAFGVASAIRITRADGGLFSVGSLTVFDHAGFACGQNFCGRSAIGFPAVSALGVSFGGAGSLDGFNNTYDSFDLSTMDARYASVRQLILNVNESFILDRINLVPVPEPSSASLWLLGAMCLLAALRSRPA